MIWYILIATFIFLGFFYRKSSKWYITSLIILFIFTGFRDLSLGGSDAIIYRNFYENIVPNIYNLNGFESKYGFGYTFLNSILKTINGNYLFFQICYASITILLIHLIIKKLKLLDNEKCLFLFVYFCYRYVWNTFVLLRQNIANLLIWLLVLYFCDWVRKYRNSTFVILLANIFHSTAIFNFVLFPILVLLKKYKPISKAIFTTIVSIILLLYSDQIFGNILDVVIKFSGERYLSITEVT